MTVLTSSEKAKTTPPPPMCLPAARVSDDAARRACEEDRKSLVVDPNRARRWLGRAAYWLLLFGLGALFVLLFVQLTGSWPVALVSVGGMGTYMVLAAKLAARHDGRGGDGYGLG